jgi:hypothetical protein
MTRQRMATRRVLAIALAVSAAALSAGCSNLLNAITSPSNTSTNASNTVTGTLAVQGSNLFTFTVANTGTVSVTLSALSAPVAVGLGVGTLNGTTACNLTSSTATVVAGSSPQINVTEDPGTYCVSVYDVGNLTGPATFSLTVAHS